MTVWLKIPTVREQIRLAPRLGLKLGAPELEVEFSPLTAR